MTYFTKLLTTSGLALLVGSSGAFADVSAEEVWASWTAYADDMGATISTGSAGMIGDTFVVTNLQFSGEAPDSSFTGEIASIELKELGDGTVSITMSPEYMLSAKFDPVGGEPGAMDLAVRQTGMSLIASGDPDAITYDFMSSEIAVAMAAFQENGEPVDMNADVVLSDLVGKYLIAEGDVREVTSASSASAVTISVSGSDPEGDGTFRFNTKLSDLKSDTTATIPAEVEMADMPAMLEAGFATKGDLTYGSSSLEMDFSGDGEKFSMQGTSGTGGLTFAMSGDGLNYQTTGTNVDLMASGSQIPFPQVRTQIAETGFGMTMPLAKSDAPQDMGLLLRLVGMTVSPEIWGMIDPGGALPRDPATLILDMVGKANWLIDITDPEAAEGADAMPGELHGLTLRELRLSFAGADLSGTGDVVFDNTDLETFDGMPAPDGGIDLTLVGGNGLLDKLVAMGLLPEDQAMGARMMMGMFARPGDGVDTLTSKIEVKKDGSVFANGQQLK